MIVSDSIKFIECPVCHLYTVKEFHVVDPVTNVIVTKVLHCTSCNYLKPPGVDGRNLSSRE